MTTLSMRILDLVILTTMILVCIFAISDFFMCKWTLDVNSLSVLVCQPTLCHPDFAIYVTNVAICRMQVYRFLSSLFFDMYGSMSGQLEL